MIEPHSAQLGESSETAKATFVVAPRLNVIGDVDLPLPFACPLETAGTSGPLAA